MELRGSIVDAYWSKYNDRRFFVATEIRMGDRTALLRDEWGYPLWHGTGWHYYSPEWESGSMSTLSGEITGIRRRKNGRFLDKGHEIFMQSNGQDYRLFMAPHWDVKHVGLKLRIGDEVSARGSMSSNSGGRQMVVQFLDVRGQRWHFRQGNGKPMWVKGAK